MAIDKLIPKVPDPYIPKNDQAQHWPACFGHINYLVDQINNNPIGGTTHSSTYSEEIIITGTQAAAGLTNFNLNTPQMNQLIADGKYLMITGGTVVVSLATPHIFSIGGVALYISKNDGGNLSNCFFVTGGNNFFLLGGATTSSTIQYKTGNMESRYEIALGGQTFVANTLSPVSLNPADKIKIILDYKAVDTSWIANP